MEYREYSGSSEVEISRKVLKSDPLSEFQL